MTLSIFDQQLFEKVVKEKYAEKETFTKLDILTILNEMSKVEKYFPKGKATVGEKYKIFKYFVRYCLYRNIANYDTMILLTGGKGCFSIDEEIKTPRGKKTIKQLALNDRDIFEVLSYDFNNKTEIKTLAQYFNTGIKETYSIELEDGRKVMATKNHKFFVRRDNEIIELKLEDIREGDEMAVSDE